MTLAPTTSPPADPAAPQGGIVLASLSKRYADGTLAVAGIDLRIEPGSYCCLLGPSGCGKTTILRMIAGHETHSGGEIRIDGRDVSGRSPRERGTAMMFQNYALFPHLSVRDNVAFALRVRGADRKSRLREADRVIEQVQLEALAERLPGQLSGGQQQRVALARAIIMRPSVLLLDEPLSALDEFLRLQMRGELRAMQRALGITFVHVTHTQLEAIAVADQVVVMDKGRIAQSGTPRDIYANPRTPYVAAFIGGQNVLRGQVSAIGTASVTLAGAAGERYVLPRGEAPTRLGEAVSFAVRRDRMQVADDSAGTPVPVNALRGRVRQLEYQGTYVKVTLQTGDPAAPDCVAYVEEEVFFDAPVALGQQVRCTWVADEARRLAALA